MTVYRSFVAVAAAAVVCAQIAVFVPVNVGFAHFVRSGRPTLRSALQHLGGFPRRQAPVFLRAALERLDGGTVLMASADRSGIGRFFRVEAAYYLFPHKLYFGRGGPVEASVKLARSLRVRYLILVRRDTRVAWPVVRGARPLAQRKCCSLVELRR